MHPFTYTDITQLKISIIYAKHVEEWKVLLYNFFERYNMNK